MSDCFKCGSDEHLSRDCPRHTSKRAAPAAANGLPPSPPNSNRPDDKPVPDRRTPAEIANPLAWGNHIRQLMGWAAGSEGELLRREAARQVRESRAEADRVRLR